MSTILVPVDGSVQSIRAVAAVLAFRSHESYRELFLLNVQPPLLGRTRGYVTHQQLDELYRAEANLALSSAIELIVAAGVPYQQRMVIGAPAEMIATVAQQVGASQIFMGTRGRGASAAILLGSVANQLASLTDLPLTLVN
ncbi:universal stress protein [Deefgea rivuli]|uniref:universal stress protein n=1 Tax=Deefgea rivuli TaxID=400948 RepID=UPI0004887A64|nr:universal stress protein [Deefgea rivuli]